LIHGKSVLVTGGAGYIGSHTCKALAERGYQPVVYDNLSRGHRWAVQWGPLETGDIRDPGRLEEVMRACRPLAILHFAALAYVGESVQDPEKYYHNNVAGSLTLLQSARRSGIEAFILSSTCAAYGIPEKTPIAEDHPLRPINPYGHSKRMVEQFLVDYEAAYGLRWVALRYFNAAGADLALQIGERHDPETHLIPLVLQAAGGQRSGIIVHGNDYPTPDGTCIRDYIHVSDLAQAHVLALEHLLRGGRPTAINLGTGQGHSVEQIIRQAERVTGHSVDTHYGPRRQGDPPILIARADMARQVLGWQPRHSDLTTILRSAWNWEQTPTPPEG
jgi:UDP-arabinose 4-epimerase